MLTFSKNFLEGQGDFVRSLTLLGWRPFAVQTPLEEYDFSVTNLATDLRDGVRLARLAEVMSGDSALMNVCFCIDPFLNQLFLLIRSVCPGSLATCDQYDTQKAQCPCGS